MIRLSFSGADMGRFRKIIRLPTGCDVDNVQAKYENGLLELRVLLYLVNRFLLTR